MAQAMIYYLAWQEDDWLDELLDFFPAVNAVVPTLKTLDLMRHQRAEGLADQRLVVLNPAGEEAKSREFLQSLTADPDWKAAPLYIVGLTEHQAPAWQEAYPQAKVIVITGFAVEFDYEGVMRQMQADLEGSA